MGILKKVKDKVAYERQSHRLGQEHLKKVKADSPDLYVKGYWKMTDAQRRAAARKAGN